MDKTESVGIIKYIGPDVKDGTIDTEKLGKALLGLNDAFKKILSQNVEYKKIDPVLKVFLQKGSVEIAAYVAAGVVVARFPSAGSQRWWRCCGGRSEEKE